MDQNEESELKTDDIPDVDLNLETGDDLIANIVLEKLREETDQVICSHCRRPF